LVFEAIVPLPLLLAGRSKQSTKYQLACNRAEGYARSATPILHFGNVLGGTVQLLRPGFDIHCRLRLRYRKSTFDMGNDFFCHRSVLD